MQEIPNRLYINTFPPLPIVSVVTSVYNRPALLERALNSILAQTFQNIEYIIVDDGSDENIDKIVIPFLNSAPFPVLYLKKENGGVHTGRNLGIKKARGQYLLILDSDDEFVPKAIETFLNAWSLIPENNRHRYREVTALCMDTKGKPLGDLYPENINYVNKKTARKIRRRLKAEHTALNRTDILQCHPWPEPEGVKFVAESLIWRILDEKYDKWSINDCLRIYHQETEDSLSTQFKKKTTQNCINDLFRHQYIVNNHKLYNLSIIERCKEILLYLIFRRVLQNKCSLPNYTWINEGIKGSFNQLLKQVLIIPSLVAIKLLRRRFYD